MKAGEVVGRLIIPEDVIGLQTEVDAESVGAKNQFRALDKLIAPLAFMNLACSCGDPEMIKKKIFIGFGFLIVFGIGLSIFEKLKGKDLGW